MTKETIFATSPISGPFTIGTITAARIQSTQPTGFRIGQYPDGSKRVQGAYAWQEGWDKGGVEWRDLPVVLVGADGQEKQND